MSRPLVSVMMPCFNAADTLPLALASLTAQSMADWECICLDDGSSDRTWDVLSAVAARDPRFRIERFAENRGRGAARQRILELGRGKYVAFQDADDWSYPGRLEHEARWLDADPHIAVVSVCAAVMRDSTLVGLIKPPVSAPLPVVARFDRPEPPPILFPTSMIDADLAKQTGFDPAFRRSQDGDFLVRAMLGRHYAHSSQVHYAYSAAATTPSTTLEGYRYRMRSHLRHWREHPLPVARTLLATTAKIAAYRAAGIVGADRRIVARRWGPLDEDTAVGFDAALAAVRQAEQRLFA
jgi:glycosyltransferase involved in cell wall biosynthesis